MVEGERFAPGSGERHKRGGGRVVAGREATAGARHEVGRRAGGTARVATRVGVDADESDDGALEARLFPELAKHRCFRGLEALDEAAGEREASFERRVASPNEQDAAALDEHRVGGERVARTAVRPDGDARGADGAGHGDYLRSTTATLSPGWGGGFPGGTAK